MSKIEDALEKARQKQIKGKDLKLLNFSSDKQIATKDLTFSNNVKTIDKNTNAMEIALMNHGELLKFHFWLSTP